MTVGTAGDNATALATTATAWRAGSQAVQPPHDALEGVKVAYAANGDNAAVAFAITHGLKNAAGANLAPTSVALTPRNAVSAAAHWVSAISSTTVTVTFGTAPATGTNNVTFYLVAYK